MISFKVLYIQLTGFGDIFWKGRKSKLFPLFGVRSSSRVSAWSLGPMLFLIFIEYISDGVTADTLVDVDDSKVKDNVKTNEDVEKLQEKPNKI